MQRERFDQPATVAGSARALESEHVMTASRSTRRQQQQQRDQQQREQQPTESKPADTPTTIVTTAGEQQPAPLTGAELALAMAQQSSANAAAAAAPAKPARVKQPKPGDGLPAVRNAPSGCLVAESVVLALRAGANTDEMIKILTELADAPQQHKQRISGSSESRLATARLYALAGIANDAPAYDPAKPAQPAPAESK